MNFISHYYCHGNENPEFNFGLLFPDFLGIVNRSFKLNQFLKDYANENDEFVLGIKNHQLADELWHYNSYFNEKTKKIKTILKSYGMADKPYRPFFMTHVMLEILIDRAILKYEPEVAINMYETLDSVQAEFLKSLFVEDALSLRFQSFYKNFTENRYTLGYVDNEKFIYALNRLFARVKHPAIELVETDNFVQQLDEIVSNDYKDPLQEITNEKISRV